MRRVTYATMVSTGGGIPTTFAVLRVNLHGGRRRTAYLDLGAHGGSVEHVATEELPEHAPRFTADDLYQMAARHASPEAPAFRWEELPA